MNAKEAARDDARAKLREWVKPGDTVYTILRHVSRYGMSRDISVVLIRPDGTILPINWLAAKAAGLAHKRDGMHDAIRMGGCGMDMGFALVYNLSHALYPEGFGCIGEGCPSNDHSNGDRNYDPSECVGVHRDDEGHATACHWHQDGGYALRQRWL